MVGLNKAGESFGVVNKSILILGVLISIAGIVMNVLLGQLQMETFRADLGSWILASYATVLLGVSVSILSTVIRIASNSAINVWRMSRYFAFLGLFNTVIAGIFVLPILDPAYEFPILITRWPGIYMIVAYFSFVLIAVLGNLSWSSLFKNLGESETRGTLPTWWLLCHIVLTQVGAYGLAIFMFDGGYAGASLDYSGAGPAIVGSVMEFAVIPSAISIFLIVAGEMTGVMLAVSLLGSRQSGIRAQVNSASQAD